MRKVRISCNTLIIPWIGFPGVRKLLKKPREKTNLYSCRLGTLDVGASYLLVIGANFTIVDRLAVLRMCYHKPCFVAKPRIQGYTCFSTYMQIQIRSNLITYLKLIFILMLSPFLYHTISLRIVRYKSFLLASSAAIIILSKKFDKAVIFSSLVICCSEFRRFLNS